MKLYGLLLALLALASTVGGLGAYTFYHAKGYSYLSDNPEACVNCHVMRDQFETWTHSSHSNWAVCNDCHMPHTFVNKWFTKALNGWNHSVAFTTLDFPEPITINARNYRIALENCLYCHERVVTEMHLDTHLISTRHETADNIACIRCHGNVGHQGR